MSATVPIIIPAYEPDEKLIKLLSEINTAGFSPIIVVNDGSDDDVYGGIFKRAENDYGVIVLKHAVNMGKGRALKDAFNYCLVEYSDLVGVITADADGQHTTTDIGRVKAELMEHLDAPDVEYREDGSVWIYYHGQSLDITDRFEDEVCYVKLVDPEKTLYVTVKYQNGFAYSPRSYCQPWTFN